MRRSLLLFISLLMLSAALGMGTGLWQKYQKGRETYEQAEQIYIRRKTEISEMPQDKEEKTEKRQKTMTAPITVDFTALRKQNPDVTGWLYIPSIELSYPVMQGEDNEYYLKHSWDRQEIFAASIFMDYRNHSDYQDCNTIIYGHNMKDGTMFHKIQYCMDKKYYEKDPYLWILTPDGDHQYEIFSEYDTRYDSDTYTIFGGPGKSLAEYLSRMQEQSLWKTEIKLKETEHIITLSTCNGAHDIRRIVQARRVD